MFIKISNKTTYKSMNKNNFIKYKEYNVEYSYLIHQSL